MSMPRQITVNCSKCGKPLTATVFESINTDFGENVPSKIINGELFNVECPHCKSVSHLEYDILYHDLIHGAMVWVVHKNSLAYSSKISEIRTTAMPPYKMLRIVEDMNALKEKVSCLEAGRDDRVIELCKVFISRKLSTQDSDFQFRNAFYTAIDEKERIHFFDHDGNNQCWDLSDDVYDTLSDLYNGSTDAKQFDSKYPVVDFAWAEDFLLPLLEIATSNPDENKKVNIDDANYLVCPHCNSKLPFDSDFCQYCGKKVTTSVSSTAAETIPLVKNTPKVVPSHSDTLTTSNRSNTNVTSKTGKGRILISLILIVGILSIALNVFQYVSYKNTIATVEEQLKTADGAIKTLEKEVASQKRSVELKQKSIDAQKQKITALEKKANNFDDIVSGMQFGNTGYAASNFFANDSVIVVRKNETNRKFKLTANWSSGGTVYVDYSSNAAVVSFDNDEWSTSTQMTVHPLSEGVTIATFSNSVNSKTFKVLIIVTA